MSSKLYILLPVHNRRAITEKFIDCLVLQSYENYHLILIDDGSTDGTSEMVSARIGNATIIRGKGHWWWAGSIQQGIDWLKKNASDDDNVLLINDDVTFAPDFLFKGLELLNRCGGMLLPQVFNEKTGNIEESGVEFNPRKLSFRKAICSERINCLPTRGLFMRMEALKINGDFRPKVLPHYLSDYEYTIRAHRKGINLATSPELLIAVDRGATGFRNFDGLSPADFFQKYFSKKSASNPIYWTVFIALVSPKIYAPWHISRVWLSSMKLIFKQVRSVFLISDRT